MTNNAATGFFKSWALAVPLCIALILAWLNPSGYRGGGADDWYYFQAAKCIAAQGWCTPETHWAARWPLLLPMSWALQIFDDARTALNFVSAAFSLSAVVLVTLIANKLGGRAAGCSAGLIFILTPAVANLLLLPNVDMAELAFLLGGTLCGIASMKRRSSWIAVLGGISFGLAVATRETAIAVIAPLFLVALRHLERHTLMLFLSSFTVIPVGEAMFHWLDSGNPLLRLNLALSHTTIASTELQGDVSMTSPLFNADVISRWQPASGIRLHWIIDPWINLFTNWECGLLLCAALALVAVRHRSVSSHTQVLAAVALMASLLLVYGLAIDPKPRMFMFAISVAAILIGMFCADQWREGKSKLYVVIMHLIPAVTVFPVATSTNWLRAENIAKQWMAETGFRANVTENSRRRLAMVPGILELPVSTSRPLLTLEFSDCRKNAARAIDVRNPEPGLMAWLRDKGLLPPSNEILMLCYYKPEF